MLHLRSAKALVLVAAVVGAAGCSTGAHATGSAHAATYCVQLRGRTAGRT